MPEGVTEIGSGAFAFNESLTEAALPDSLRRIGVRAFMNCSGLRRVSLPKGLLRIGSGAFRDCGALTGLPLPEEPVKLGDDVFSGCRGLADKNGFLIHRGVLYGYFGPRREVSVPEGVKRIAGYAFGKWEGVLRLRLPDSLERIPPNAFSEGGDLVLVVRRWTRELSDAAAGCRIRALWTEDPSLVPRGLQRAARLGIAFAPEALPDTEETREAEDWFSRNAASLCRDAFELPELLQFLCRRRLLRPGDLDGYLEAARECDSPEITALLLNYMNVLGADTVYRVRERKQTRQEAAEEARARRLGARKPEDGIAGLRFAAEGTLRSWMTRRDLQTWLEARGAKLGTAVTARTDWLITDDPEADSDRLKKAEALGVPLISGTELLAMAGETGRRG